MSKAIVEIVKYDGIVTSDIPVGSYRVLNLSCQLDPCYIITNTTVELVNTSFRLPSQPNTWVNNVTDKSEIKLVGFGESTPNASASIG